MNIEKYNINIQRDVLRVNKEGKISKLKFPKNIGLNNQFIKQTDDNYLIKVVSPIASSAYIAYEKFSEITNVLTEEIYNEGELIWPLDNYLSGGFDIDLHTKINISLNSNLIKTSKFKKAEDINKAIKKNLDSINILKDIYGPIKVKASDKVVTISNISLNANERYGISLDQVLFIVACVFTVLEDVDLSKNVFKILEKINKKYNLKAEEAITRFSKEIPKSPKMNFAKALKLASKYMEVGHLQRYTIQNHEALVAESKVLIKDAILQGINYDILNEAKSVVSFNRGKHQEFVIAGNKTDRDSYIFPIITDDKFTSKQIMKSAGINVPDAILLDSSMNEADLEELLKPYYNKKLVVKPRNTNYGTGITVFSEPATKKQIMNAVEYAFEFDNNVLIEQYVKGMEYRFLVVNGKCLSVAHRRIASVVGDGKSTISELIKAKNKEQWHALTGCPVKQDRPVQEYLKLQGLTLDSVIPNNKRIFLRTNSNCSTGGESLDFTDVMPTRFKNIAEKAAKAFDAKICGVDIIIDDMKKSDYAIIEINDNPGYSINEWPYEGNGEKIGVSILKLLSLVK